jgi:hypothetical protein
MSAQNIIQNLISRLGQSQDERLPPELGRHFADIDERSRETLLAQARALAKLLPFYQANGAVVPGGWSSFFPEGDSTAFPKRDDAVLLTTADGTVPPHLGLFLSFLELYRFPQQAINENTGKHLDFQFRRVLRFEPRPAQPDRAHLVLELKKGSEPLVIAPTQSFSAGKDSRGVELIYQPVREVVLNRGKVAALSSVFRDATGLRFAPVANSADGLGGALDEAQPKWHAFGHAALSAAPIGFALASPVLRMQEGTRNIQVDLTLAALDQLRHMASALANAFEAYLSGAKGWLGPFPLMGGVADNRLTLTLQVPATQPAIIDYNVGVHGHAFAAQAPVLQLLLKPEAALHYADLEGLTLRTGRISVEVEALTSLTLENDLGSLNPKKAFQPFGAQPVIGSRFLIDCDEALSKRLLDLSVKLTWQAAPPDLPNHYLNYDNGSRMANGVSAMLIYQDRNGQRKSTTLDLMHRDDSGVSTLSLSAPPPGPESFLSDFRFFALQSAGSLIGREFGRRLMRERPIHQRIQVPPPVVRSGFIIVSLVEDFLHADYRRETIANAVAQNKKVLNEPYTPTVQGISLGYQAQSDEVDFSALNDVGGLASFTNLDLQFFHVGCFGQMREHSFLRQQFGYVDDKRVSLLPAYPHQGEFLIGLSGVAAGDSVSLLMQVAEGSADPELPAQELTWSVMGDNYWRPLTAREQVLDTSHALRASGIVALALPAETTTEHTFLPTGLVWLRATVPEHSAAVCQLVEVANNAVEVRFVDQSNDPAHLASALAAGRIAKVKAPPAAVKTITQPFASFGGHLPETDEMLTRRAAERLRHRNRCLTPWDYERMLLEAFPEIHKVKCLPHASPTSWLAAGHVLLVVVPDLRNRNAVDPLQPRVDLDTLTRVAEFARQHCGMFAQNLGGTQVSIHVKNPRYQRVRLRFKVHFQPGYAFNFHRQILNEALIRELSPWTFDARRPLAFGGQLYRSVLLNFVEELPYVDFVTDFQLLSPDSATPQRDLTTISAETPDAILVSDASHTIDEYQEA